ncbi:MAG: 50S ribosome-binding GTPase [Synergistaceae bacterium]|nr:50S ribosome-binding GTPase [Synergistaceae bacterium]MBQ3397694.1 50S ribosome-binding GTPase [Synergistaceae bacterium]MBQ6115179.1 50S ribosome-binding GTPase [Synergistaceae bacterium]MBQ6981292.1 50S ribosome-binding GTPase [Synergistaceae bacterium]
MPRTVWYPGHMAKGSRKLRELAERLDVIVEVRDSRAPSSTSSPLIKSLAKIKPVIRVLSRKDLADPEKLALWVNSLKFAHTADLRKREGISQIRRDILKFKPAHREVRLAVVGIPNVGKSLLLNTLVGKSSASVGNIPGVTKSVNWYKNEGMLIVDSPGILDPHAEPGAHMMLSWLGCAKADVVGGWENSAISLVKFLTHSGMAGMIPVEPDEIPAVTLELIGRKYGCLISGGRVNMELAGQKFIEAFSSGRLGRFCLEVPGGERAVDFHDDEADILD